MDRTPRKYEAWPDWAYEQARNTASKSNENPWKNDFTGIDVMHAGDGQRSQFAYPFDYVVLAKFMCEAAGDDCRLFMKYLKEASDRINELENKGRDDEQ